MTGSAGYKLGLSLFQCILGSWGMSYLKKIPVSFLYVHPFGFLKLLCKLFFFFFSPKILFHYAHTFPGFLPKLVAWIKICTYSSLVFFKNWGTLWFAALKKHGRNKYSECTRLRRYFYKEVALGLTVGTSENSWGKSLFLLINWKQQEVRNSCAFWCFSK